MLKRAIFKSILDELYSKNLAKTYTRRINDVLKANDNVKKFRLSKNQIESVLDFWKPYKVKPNLNWYKAYTYSFGSFSEYFIPDEIFFLYLEPYYNNLFFSKAYDDKNNYDRFYDVTTPETYLRRIRNVFYDNHYNLINTNDKLKDHLKQINGEVIIKPTIFEGGGRDIKKGIIKYPELIINERSLDVFNYLMHYSSDFIIQKVQPQHPVIADIYPHSLNCIRVISMRFNNKIHILSSVIKFGNKGSYLDGQKFGGINCSVDENGKVGNLAFNDRAFERYDKHPYTDKPFGFEIPGYQNLIKKVKEMHAQLFHLNIVSWDMSVDPELNPVLIEQNSAFQAITLQQANNGPLFGEMTKEVLNEAFHKPQKRVYVRFA